MPKLPPGRGRPGHRDVRPRLGHGELPRPGDRRGADALHGHAVHRRGRADADDRQRQPAADLDRGLRAPTRAPRTRSASRRPTAAAPARSRPPRTASPRRAPAVPAAPTGVDASAGQSQATVEWTAPHDGGRTITRYTVTPYLSGVAQTPTTVEGSPAPAKATSPASPTAPRYTFKVSATNAVGDRARLGGLERRHADPGPALRAARVGARRTPRLCR